MIQHDRESIERSAVATLLYFDIFDHPLTVEETFAFLPHNSISVEEFRAAIAGSAAIARYHVDARDLLTVPGRPAAWAETRIAKERHAAGMWKRARIVARLIACFPFVRAVAVSGSLSKNATDRAADIDWFIITAPRRLWICKTLLTLFRRTALFNRTKYFCTNYYVSADALEIPDRNVFVATEIATLRPMVNAPLVARFRAANAWTKRFLPNVDPAAGTSHVVRGRFAGIVRAIAELPFRGAWGDWMEARALATHVRFERRKHADLAARDFDLMFRSGPTVCKIHQRNFQRRVIEAYAARLRQFHVDRVIVEGE